jgi:hypothetical protein
MPPIDANVRQVGPGWQYPAGALFVRSSRYGTGQSDMNRNVITLVIGVLAIAIVVLGYQLYQERQKKSGVEISIGDRGISIEKK